ALHVLSGGALADVRIPAVAIGLAQATNGGIATDGISTIGETRGGVGKAAGILNLQKEVEQTARHSDIERPQTPGQNRSMPTAPLSTPQTPAIYFGGSSQRGK